MVSILSLLLLLVVVLAIVTLSILSTRINRIEQELRQLARRLPQEPPASAAAPAPARVPPAPAVPPVAAPARSVSPPSPPAALALPPPRPSRTKEEWESLIGGKLLNRIGALALIIGVGFFLKYAVDRNWINENIRVGIGVVLGGGLLFVAARTHARGLQIFSQGLVGAGISILYLSVYASFNFYHLVPQLAAFALMTGVTAIAFYNAFRYDSLAVALLAWLGGFLTPFLLSTGESNELGLFTYIALLDAGILLISLRKPSWIVLEPLALGATWLIYALWYSTDYRPEAFSLTLYFILVFWLLFHALASGRALGAGATKPILRGIATAANALFGSIALYRILEPEMHAWAGPAELLMALIIAASALATVRRRGHDPWVAFAGMTAGILVIDATAIQYAGTTTASLWALEALGFAWLGSRWQRTYLSWLAFVLFTGAGLKLIFTAGAVFPLHGEDVGFLLNRRALAYATLIGSAWIAGGLFGHLKGGAAKTVPAFLSSGASAMLLLMVTVEISAYFTGLIRSGIASADAADFGRWMALAAAWAGTGAVLVWTGTGRSSPPLYYSGLIGLLMGFCAAAIRGIAFDPVAGFTLLVNWRCAALLFTAACGFFVVRRLEGPRAPAPGGAGMISFVRMATVMLLLVLATGETRDLYERAIALTGGMDGYRVAEELDQLENLKQLSLSGVWLVFSILLMGVGIWRRSRVLRIGSMVIFGMTILKIFIYDLSFLDTLYRIFSFIGLGVILLAVSYLYQRYKGIILAPGGGAPPPPPATP